MQTTATVIKSNDNYIDFHAGNSILGDWPKLSLKVHMLIQDRLLHLHTFIDCMNYIAKPLNGYAMMITDTRARLQFITREDALAFTLEWK